MLSFQPTDLHLICYVCFEIRFSSKVSKSLRICMQVRNQHRKVYQEWESLPIHLNSLSTLLLVLLFLSYSSFRLLIGESDLLPFAFRVYAKLMIMNMAHGILPLL